MCEEVKLLLAWKDKLATGPWGEWRYRPGNLPYVKYSQTVEDFIREVELFVYDQPQLNLENYQLILSQAQVDVETVTELSNLSLQVLLAALVRIIKREEFSEGYILRFLQNRLIVDILVELAQKLSSTTEKKYMFCQVEFIPDAPLYTYLCDDETVKEGDEVVVPVGPAEEMHIVKVKKIIYATAANAPYPFERCKKVIEKLEIRSDLSAVEKDIFTVTSQSVDALDTLIGTFRLKKDDRSLAIECLEACFSKTNENQRGTLIVKAARLDVYLTDPGVYLCLDNTPKVQMLEKITQSLGGIGNEWQKIELRSVNDLEMQLEEAPELAKVELKFASSHDVSAILIDYFITADGITVYFSEWEKNNE